jgi:hemolysin III
VRSARAAAPGVGPAVDTEAAARAVPRLRGRIHQVAFLVAVPTGAALVGLARGGAARLGAAVYALGLVAVFGSSAAYHRGAWGPAARRRMKRLDHSMIYVLIGATYTPVALLVLHGPWRVALLAAVWAGAVLGIALKLARIDGFRVATAALYMGLGWLAVVALPQLVRGMPARALVLTVAGGLLYTAGAIVFALRRPDPSPAVFGYHEVWHAFMVAAAACHSAMIALLVAR